MLAPVGDFHRRSGFRAQRDVVRADLDDSERRIRRRTFRRGGAAAETAASSVAGLRTADCDDRDEPRDDGGLGGETCSPESEQHLAHLRGALELPHDAIEPETAPRGGQGDGEELCGSVVQGRGREGCGHAASGVATALILPSRQDENKRILAVFRQYFVRNREWRTI